MGKKTSGKQHNQQQDEANCSLKDDDSNQIDANEICEDVWHAEKVVNAFNYYQKYGKQWVANTLNHLRHLPAEHQRLIGDTHGDHIRKVLKCIEHNQQVINEITKEAPGTFGEEFKNQMEKALKITQPRVPDSNYKSRVLSTMRQVVREWSDEGKPDRDATFKPVIEALRELFPDENSRPDIKILLPGCGLGRLPWDLIAEGFSVTGNEFSLFMLIFSSYFLNCRPEANQFTFYPYIFDKSNSWSYEDQTRAVSFPDIAPAGIEIRGRFSMCAGSFLDVTSDDKDHWDCLVTAWFIDTANNIIDYIENIYNILKPGGTWVNVGPLTYHFEDVNDELSIELPYSEIRRLILQKGFEISKETKIDSKYTVNCRSMLSSQYTCAFFVAKKPL